MTAALRLRILPRFPARIEGADGVKVTRPPNSPDLTVSLDIGNLGEMAGIPNPAQNYFAMWNAETRSHVRIPFQSMFDSSGVSAGYPTRAAAELATILPTIHAIEVYGGAVVGDGLGGLYIDADNGSSDTFVSGDGRTWYRAADVGTDRLINQSITETKISDALATKVNGAMQKATYDPQGKEADAFPYDTEADFLAATIPLTVQIVTTNGYYAPGDGGGHMKRRIAAPETPLPWHKQSADGAWWEIAGETINPRGLGVKGDYATDDTNALNNVFDFFVATGRPINSGPMNIRYVGSRRLPAGIVWRGVGAARLDVWFPSEGDGLNVRPGYKHLVSGTNIWFSGAATQSHATNRVDVSAISYGFYHQSNKPPQITGVGFILDFDIYDTAGTMTGAANDNRADYDCVFLQQGPLGKITQCLFRGFANYQCLVIYGQADQSEIDSDYNKIVQCSIQGHAILTGDGSVPSATQGSTGNVFDVCDIYSTADHHSIVDGDYSKRMFLIDGFLGTSKGGIRGTTYNACHFRTRANQTGEFGYCNDVMIIGGTSEFPTVAGVPGADSAGKFINPNERAKTLYFVGFASGNSGGAGIQELANSANVITLGSGFGNDITISRNGVFARLGIDEVGSPFMQMGRDAASVTDGWQIQFDADNAGSLSARYNSSEKWRIDINGNAQFDGSVQMDGGAKLPPYTVAELLDGTTKPAAENARVMIFVSNGVSGKKLAISDGTVWRYPDGSVV